MTDLVPLGIHFNLPAPTYHDDPAFGSGSQKALALDPVEFQHERLKPKDPADEDKMAFVWGRALHARVLEGRAALTAEFAAIPRLSDHPGALVTMKDLRAAQKALGMRGGISKEDVSAMIRDHDPDAVIWEDILTEFYKGIGTKTAVDHDWLAEIEEASSWMQKDATIGPVMVDGAFTGGAPEVSIFYEDRGVRCKARIDYMLPNSAIVDLKSFRPTRRGARPVEAALTSIVNERYDLQRASYIMAWREGRIHAAAGRAFGDQPYRGFLADVYGVENPNWLWVMTKATGAPQPLVIEFPAGTHSWVAGRADNDIERGIAAYIENRDKFGDDKPWPPQHPVTRVDDTIWPFGFGR